MSIRAPKYKAGILSAVVVAAVVILGWWSFHWLIKSPSSPLERGYRAKREQFDRFFSTAPTSEEVENRFGPGRSLSKSEGLRLIRMFVAHREQEHASKQLLHHSNAVFFNVDADTTCFIFYDNPLTVTNFVIGGQ